MQLSPRDTEIGIWRVASLMLKRFGENAQAESARRVDELAKDGDHPAPGRVVNHCDHHRSEFAVALLTVHQKRTVLAALRRQQRLLVANIVVI